MSNNFQDFLTVAGNTSGLPDQIRAFLRTLEPKNTTDDSVDDEVPIIAHLVSGAPVPLKMKVWRKLDAKVAAFATMAKEDWPTNSPGPQDQLEVLGFVLKKKLASYVDMQEVHNPLELTAVADAVDKASKTLESVLLLVGKFKEEYAAAKAAEAAFVKTLS